MEHLPLPPPLPQQLPLPLPPLPPLPPPPEVYVATTAGCLLPVPAAPSLQTRVLAVFAQHISGEVPVTLFAEQRRPEPRERFLPLGVAGPVQETPLQALDRQVAALYARCRGHEDYTWGFTVFATTVARLPGVLASLHAGARRGAKRPDARFPVIAACEERIVEVLQDCMRAQGARFD